MIKRIKLLFFFITTLSIHCFAQTASVNKGCVPLQVNFTAPAGSSTYFWDFKDGVTANIQNPTNVFNKAGTYNVTFSETPGGPVIGTLPIIIYPDPVLNISVSKGCAPLNAQFQDLSTINPGITVTNYVWVFGDGQASQGVQNASHLYSSVGMYSTSFSVETNFPTCNKTVIFTDAVEVLAPPVASFTTTPSNTVTCNDTINVSFSNTSTGVKPLTYSWNLGTGHGTSSAQNPPVQKYINGLFNSSLTVSYGPALTGCNSSASQIISAGRPIANIQTKKDTVCLDAETYFKTTTPGIYSWTLDAAAVVSNTTPLNSDSISVIFNSPGFHSVTLVITSYDGLCSDTKTKKIYVDQVTAQITSVDPSFSCKSPMTVHLKALSNQGNVKYQWLSGATTQSITSTMKSPTDSIYYSINDTLLLNFNSVIVTSRKTGCSGTAERFDTLGLPNARFVPNKSRGCIPLTVAFSDSSTSISINKIVSWKWIYGDGTTSPVLFTKPAPTTHTYTTAGSFRPRLVVTTEKGCIDTSYAVLIEAGTDLTGQVDFTANKSSVCPGEQVTFTVNPTNANVDAYHFTSEGNRTFQCQNQTTLPWTYDYVTGPQTVSLTTDYNGCLTTITKNNFVTVKGAVAKIDYYALCKHPLDYTFKNKGSGATSLQWDFGDAQTSTASTETHTYASTGDYSVTLTAQNTASGCAATIDRATIYVRNLKGKISVDTLMCPNKAYVFDASASTDVDANCHTGYTWSFPGQNLRPNTSANAAVSYDFSVGNYTAMLIVKDINGCKDTTTRKFKVYDMVVTPSVNKQNICLPASVQFSDLSTSDTTITNILWDFGDLSTSTVKNPSHSYTGSATGSFYVTLKLTDILGCTRTTPMSVNIYQPFTTISPANPTLCLGQTVSLSADDFTQMGNNLTYSWDFGNGNTSTSQSNPPILYPEGNYLVTLNFKETNTGCEGSVTTNVQVQSYPVAYISTPNLNGLTVLCAPQNVFFKDSSQSAYPLYHQWDFGNGTTSIYPDYSLFYPKGNYHVIHRVFTSFGCADTATADYNVYSPEGNFTIDKNTICKSEVITFTIKDTADVASYTWAFGDGIVADDIAPVSHRYNFHPPSGQTAARLIIRGVDGICPVELQQTVNIHEVIADFIRENGVDTSICFSKGAYQLTNTSIGYDSINWLFGDSTTSSTPVLNHTYAKPGVYDVSLAVANIQFGCKDTITKQAVIYPNPQLLTAGDTACQGSLLHLKVLNPKATDKYLWTPYTGLSDSSSAVPSSNIIHSLIYNVLATDTNGCTGSANVPGIIIEPSSLFNWDTSIVIGDQVTLPVYTPPVYTYQWTPDTGLSCLTCNYPLVRPLQDITYNLKVTDIRGCFPPDYYKYKIEVKPETFVKLPTAFTPDGDDANDRLYVRGWGIKELQEFQIFNRWGQLVYSSVDINEGWDGTFKGVVQNSDMYAWKVKVLTWRNESIQKEGYVNLLH